MMLQNFVKLDIKSYHAKFPFVSASTLRTHTQIASSISA